ncbi:hypothetical protein MSAN_01323200 [Mycena sanguinolenta]|uniref:Uncharacterized protein n=1 Tax=Mycena sanguinolenta TaxID=230812 RepID=A0A8H6YCM8_9AGAR|nr:hypothetical protein MSAN_01323200 [Mycena sanguinolenta]
MLLDTYDSFEANPERAAGRYLRDHLSILRCHTRKNVGAWHDSSTTNIPQHLETEEVQNQARTSTSVNTAVGSPWA